MSLFEFLRAETHEIEIYKWIESEKAGYDLGVVAEIEWVECYAKKFRKEFEEKFGKVEC